MATPRTATRSSDPLLESVRARRAAEARDQVATLAAVLDWAAAQVAGDEEAAALLDPSDPNAERSLHLAGPGAPVVGEDAALDLARSLGGSSDAGLAYLGKALELRYRLPRLHARVVALEVSLWKAFRVAEQTMTLPVAGAGFVDRAVTPFLHSCSWAQVTRSVDHARAVFDPEEAERRRVEAAEQRHADVHLDHATTDGTVEVTATLDLADGLDLEAALREGARVLVGLGSTESLEVRRSQALGQMARHQLALDLDVPAPRRGVMIHAHLEAGDTYLRGYVDHTLTPVLVEQVRAWCAQADTRVTIKPVIDLAADPSTTAYRPTEEIRELVVLRDRSCVFPECRRRRVDLDHVVPFDTGGPTSAHNLAMLCRRHHRAKTRGRWSYRVLEPGCYEWTSPTGVTRLVDRGPPGRRRP
jgi:5-methylcytosine-specific restriction endonuclease McrA